MGHVPSAKCVAAMTPVQLKIYTNLVRRVADRRRLRVQKSRRRDPGAYDYGVCSLINSKGKVVASGTLVEIHAWLLHTPQ
jgi:hypothetical protein